MAGVFLLLRSRDAPFFVPIFRRCHMGIKSLFGFGQARDKPVDKAADAGYSFLFGRTTSGKPVNERTAM